MQALLLSSLTMGTTKLVTRLCSDLRHLNAYLADSSSRKHEPGGNGTPTGP